MNDRLPRKLSAILYADIAEYSRLTGEDEESLKAQLGIEGFILRMRAVTVEPGGHILEHNHATRPGMVMMVSGTWIEGHPDWREITYRAGEDVALLEDKDTVYWIYNRGNEPATGIVCGIQPSK